MYKDRFAHWGFVKLNTETDIKRVLRVKHQRNAEGKMSQFIRDGKALNLGLYLKRKGMSEDELINNQVPDFLPAYIRCRTPTPPQA